MIRVHANCIAVRGAGVLITGASGSGKSDLSLRLIDRGAHLVSDDYSEIFVCDGQLRARPPQTIAGKIEVRGLGIISLPYQSEVVIRLHIALAHSVARMPLTPHSETFAGIAVRSFALAGLEPSAPIKLERILGRVLEESA